MCYAYAPGTTPNSTLMFTEEFLEEAATKWARLVYHIHWPLSRFVWSIKFQNLQNLFKKVN